MTVANEHHSGDESGLPDTDAASLERLKRFGGGKLLGEMISLFLSTAPERIEAVRSGLAHGDAKAAEMAFHSLKSSSAQLGAMRMQRICERGEALAKAGSLAEVPALQQQLDAEFPRVQQWLERARQSEVA